MTSLESDNPISEAEKRLIIALAWMCDQHLDDGQGYLDHRFISANERSIALLADYGVVEQDVRGGVSTEMGKALLKN